MLCNHQLDFTQQDGRTDESFLFWFQFDSCLFLCLTEKARSNTTHLTVSSLDDSQRSSLENDLQPEDQDEQLEITLRSHGSSFVELYPCMVSRIETAWHRQNVSEAADSVLRRYRKWRKQSNRVNLNNTFVVTHGPTDSNSKKTTRKAPLKEASNNMKKMSFMSTESIPCSSLQMETNVEDWKAQQSPPEFESGSLRRQQHQPILVMDFSGPSDTPTQKEISLNETFTVSDPSQLGKLNYSCAASPSRHPTAKASLDLPLSSKRFSLSAHSEQAAECPMDVSEMSVVKESPFTYASPVRKSPLKGRMMMSLSASPQSFSRSPKKYALENFSREPTSKMLCPQDSHLSPQLRRHLSFDSSLPFIQDSSPKKLDEDFIKLYHKFVCQNKSPLFNSPPCRFCARSSDAVRVQSSSALAALALSPQRSVLRKRHRQGGCGGNPLSKRSRDECYTSSPGSKRHRNEMLRFSASPSELSNDDLTYSSTKYSMFSKFSMQQRSAIVHQEVWKRQGPPASATDNSAPGKPSNTA
uniref:Uncharacterized protein n=1 Tax=Echeneis naucrates TaxID=173247 RepID=A0A665VA90_ECHNA